MLGGALGKFDSEDGMIEEAEVFMKGSKLKRNKSSNKYLMESKKEIIRFIYSITEK